jgi:phenylacetate-CoA ligase
MYNFLLEKFLLPMGDFFLGSSFIKELNKWRKIQWLPKEELDNLQRSNLEKLISFSLEKIPYYRELGIETTSDPYENLRKFPILTKDLLKEHTDDLVVDSKSKLVKEVSSGSSGIRSEVYMDKCAASTSQAIQTMIWEWAGYKIGSPIIQLGINPKRGFERGVKDLLFRTNYQHAFKIDEKIILEVLGKYQQRKETVFVGFASGLYSYALLAKAYNFKDVIFKSAISLGDKLFPHYVELISEQFHTRVYDTYGCNEGFVFAGECSNGNMHIITPHVFLELVDKDGNEVAPGDLGYVIGTRLDSLAMPLIRYYVGDLAVKADPEKTCNCGRALPILKKIIGRDTDLVRTKSNKYLTVHTFTGIFKNVFEIKQFRVIQRKINGIEIEYIPDIGFKSQVLNVIKSKLLKELDEEFLIEFKEVDHIPDTPSGKPQMVKSLLNDKTVLGRIE